VIRSGTKSEGSKRIYITGKVLPVNDLETVLEADEEERNNGEESQYGPFPEFVTRQLKKLTKQKRRAFLKRWEETSAQVKQLQADVMEAARTIAEQIEDNTFAEFGIRNIRIVRRDEKRKAKDDQRKARLQPLIREIEKFVQTSFNFEAEVCTETKNVPVQTSASLLNKTENYQRGAHPSSSSSATVPHGTSVSEIEAAAAAFPATEDLPSGERSQAAATRSPSQTQNEPAVVRKPSPKQAAEVLVQMLAESHRTVEPPGSIRAAREQAEAVLAHAPDIEVKCAEIRASHTQCKELWTAKRANNPATFVPQLWRWFQDGDYLHPPSQEAIATASLPANGHKKKKEPDWLERERRIANGETV
jgi:hypothetical protein